MRALNRRIIAALWSWNWKAAVLSGAARAPIFFLSTVHYGLRAMSSAALVEFIYRISSAGFFASFIQSRRKSGTWVSALQVSVLVPALCLSLDYAVHHAVGTPNLKTSITISFFVSSFSSLFNWYSMKRGVFITGHQSKSLLSDLRAIPVVLVGFVMEPSLWLWRMGRQALQSGVH